MDYFDSKRILLVGGGGHASSLLENFNDAIAGYIAPQDSPNLRAEWFGTDEKASEFSGLGYVFHISFIYSGQPSMALRKNLIDKYNDAGLPLISLISENTLISRSTKVGEGSAVLPGAILNKVTAGTNVVVNSGAIIEHDSIVGNNCFIGPGAVIGGNVNIGDDCFIGLGAKIRNGVSIPSGTIIGMGSLVTKDIHEPGIYYGII